MEELFNTQEVADKLKVTVKTVRNYIERGQLKASRLSGRKFIIREKDLIEFLDNLEPAEQKQKKD